MTDVAPELLERIQKTFGTFQAGDSKLWEMYWEIRDGKANYETVNRYAIRLGELLSDALRKEISVDTLPDGRMYYNIAERVLGPLLENNHELVADAAEAAQNAMNAAAGLGLKAVRPALNQSRVDGLIDKVSSYESFEDAAWVLNEPVVNFTQSVVDDAIRENVAAQARAGLSPTVKRIAESGCCNWCSNLAGTYEYPVDRDVYRRHERCRCLVLFDPKTGKVQNAHTKVQYANAQKAERDSRIARAQELQKQKEQASTAKREMLRKLETGEYKLKILWEKSGSAVHHRSIGYGNLSISRDEQQRLISSLSGLGTPRIGKNGRAQNIEFVTADKPIGTITEWFPEKRVIETRRMAIVHTRDGSYIVPVKPGRTS